MKQILASNDDIADIAGSPIDVIHLESNTSPPEPETGK